MPTIARTSTLLALVLLTLAACHRRQVETVVPRSETASAPSGDDRDRLEKERLDRERAERARLERERAERERALAELRKTMAAPIYFAFDRSDLTPEARQTLEAKWSILSANPSMHIRIEGNADDLGSDEYNLALGQRRAAAAKDYLTRREIDPARIEVVSFGEERPACQGSGDDCRARNRRDEVQVTAGDPAATQR
jgi:peptidoglycan-associated lipoprotein